MYVYTCVCVCMYEEESDDAADSLKRLDSEITKLNVRTSRWNTAWLVWYPRVTILNLSTSLTNYLMNLQVTTLHLYLPMKYPMIRRILLRVSLNSTAVPSDELPHKSASH